MTVRLFIHSAHKRADTTALVDSGATENFLNLEYARWLKLPVKRLAEPRKLYNVDGSLNKGGDLRFYTDLSVRTGPTQTRLRFFLTELGDHKAILGYPWFAAVQPNIDWKRGWIDHSQLPIILRAPDAQKAQFLPKNQKPIIPERYYIGRVTIEPTTPPEQSLEEAKAKIPKEYHRHARIFSEQHSHRLPAHSVWDHAIELLPGAPTTLPGRLLPLTQEEVAECHKFVEEHLSRGTIRESKSPYAANFFFVKKKDGKLRPVQDYRPLNKWTIRNRNVSPLIPEVIDRLAGCTLFTKFDVRWGYNNIRIREGDEWKAAFLTPEGLFEPLVMFFGLTNSPATFQTMINTEFRPWVKAGVFSGYMDDGVIHTKQLPHETKEQHLMRHRKIAHEIFSQIAMLDLFLKPEKCQFEQTQIEYLGVIVGEGKIQMDPSKTNALLKWPRPRNVRDVRAILGYTGYYRRFIKNYSSLARPLIDLTKKGIEFTWEKRHQEAFDTLIGLMAARPILLQPNFNKQFVLQTNASALGVGAVLLQQGDTKKLQPVEFFSATFTPTERNYDIYERELLAIMKALAHWRPYLGWTKEPFLIQTDHANLQYWKSPRNLNRRTARWHADLQDYDFVLQHIPGKTNTLPDLLSRLPTDDDGKGDNKDVVMLPPERLMTAATCPPGKTLVPALPEVRRGILQIYHDHPSSGHPGRDETIRKIQERFWWPRMKEWIAEYIQGCSVCQQSKILTHRPKVPMYKIPTVSNARPFQRVAMDLITGLPQRKGYNTILTIVDQGCSRAAVFLPCSTEITGPGIAQLYFEHVYRWFGLPDKIISDRDPRFTSHFGRALTKKLGIEQNLSSAFHPQTDGLSERKNQWIEQYLRIVTSQHPEDWTNWLALATAVHNNRRNVTTGLSPNQILLGIEPPLVPQKETPTGNQLAEERIKLMERHRREAVDALQRAAGKAPEPSKVFTKGSQVWLEATHLKLPYQVSKLNPKRYGPFPIAEVISPIAYRLLLPNNWRIHDVFHASLLTPYRETGNHGPNFSRPPPDLVDGEEEQEIERIINHRRYGRAQKLQYLIKWKGFPDSDNEWVDPAHMHASDLISKYHRKHPLDAIKATTVSSRSSLPSSPTTQCLPTPLTCLTSPRPPLEPVLLPWLSNSQVPTPQSLSQYPLERRLPFLARCPKPPRNTITDPSTRFPYLLTRLPSHHPLSHFKWSQLRLPTRPSAPLVCSTTPTIRRLHSPRGPPLLSWKGTSTATTPSSLSTSSVRLSPRSKSEKKSTSRRSNRSTIPWTLSNRRSSTTRKPSLLRQTDTSRTMDTTQPWRSASLMASDAPPNGSSNSITTAWPPSVTETLGRAPPLSSTSMPPQTIPTDLYNPFLTGSSIFSPPMPPPTPSFKTLPLSSTIGDWPPIWTDSAELMPNSSIFTSKSTPTPLKPSVLYERRPPSDLDSSSQRSVINSIISRDYPTTGMPIADDPPGSPWEMHEDVQCKRRGDVTGPRDVGDRSRRGKIGVTGPGHVARISGKATSGLAGNYQGCTIV